MARKNWIPTPIRETTYEGVSVKKGVRVSLELKFETANAQMQVVIRDGSATTCVSINGRLPKRLNCAREEIGNELTLHIKAESVDSIRYEVRYETTKYLATRQKPTEAIFIEPAVCAAAGD